MTSLRIELTPRDIPARMRATCSDVSLDVEVAYDTPRLTGETDIQRQIHTLVQLPSPAWRVRIGDLELCFGDGVRLSSLGLYENFAVAEPEDLPLLPDAPPAWITLPELDPVDDDMFSIEAVLRVSIDRRQGALRVRMADVGDGHRSFSLAEGLVVRMDASRRLADITVHGIEWTDSAPMPSSA